MNRAAYLRAALLANAVFSTICAMLMILCPGWVGTLLGVEAPLVIRGIGFGLALFAADLIHQATRSRIATWRALYAGVADFLWVLGTLVGIAFFPGVLSASGLVTVLTVAGIVFTFGVWQLRGIRLAHGAGDPTLYRHCIVVRVDADADAMWSVVERIGDIKKYMPTLHSSVVLDGGEAGSRGDPQLRRYRRQVLVRGVHRVQAGRRFRRAVPRGRARLSVPCDHNRRRLGGYPAGVRHGRDGVVGDATEAQVAGHRDPSIAGVQGRPRFPAGHRTHGPGRARVRR